MNIVDATDLKILALLQQDASLSSKQIADRCHVSEATCSRRLKALKKNGYIEKFTVLLNLKKLGFTLSVYVLVSMETERAADMKRFVNHLRDAPEVLSISFISGEYDFLLHLVSKDMQQYNAFTENYLTDALHVKKYQSLFEMKSHKTGAMLPIANLL